MKNYRHHSAHQITNNSYVKESKSSDTNFNSSIQNKNIIDVYIDKWIMSSSQYIAPFFEDEDTFTNQVREINTKELDQAFDNALPKWTQWIFNIISRAYLMVFPENEPNLIQVSLKPTLNASLDTLKKVFLRIKDKFNTDNPIP